MKRSKGFTLIELLIVVAIIGILAALLIPNAITAIQKAKQKSTMKDITTMATGLADYITDNGNYANLSQSGAIVDTTRQALAPFYMKTCPSRDAWGAFYQVYLGSGCVGQYGIDTAMISNEDFVLYSYGKDQAGDGWTYDTSNPEMGMYTVTTMQDFNYDLVNWSGSWIRAPRVARSAS